MSGQLDFTELQLIQAQLIAANPYFDGVSVIVDDGDRFKQHEAALQALGVSIMVLPVTDGVRSSQAGRQISIDFLNTIQLSVNTVRNAASDGAGLNIFEAIRQIMISVLKYSRLPGEPFWSVPERPVRMVTFNPGLWEYEMSFVRNLLFA